jgi:hypothetical protein
MLHVLKVLFLFSIKQMQIGSHSSLTGAAVKTQELVTMFVMKLLFTPSLYHKSTLILNVKVNSINLLPKEYSADF